LLRIDLCRSFWRRRCTSPCDYQETNSCPCRIKLLCTVLGWHNVEGNSVELMAERSSLEKLLSGLNHRSCKVRSVRTTGTSERHHRDIFKTLLQRLNPFIERGYPLHQFRNLIRSLVGVARFGIHPVSCGGKDAANSNKQCDLTRDCLLSAKSRPLPSF